MSPVASVTVVVGNPRPESRTFRVASAVAGALVAPANGFELGMVLDLASVASQLFDPDAPIIDDLLARVATSDVVVVASPTYKATYTALLKAFLDRYGNDGLAGTIAVPVMTGAAPVHSLAVEVHLRALLVELGASLPSRGLYVLEHQFDDLDAVVGAWAATARPLIERGVAGGGPTR
jgi:FMN reductase